MNFYEILKTKKLGRGSPDYWTQLFSEHVGGTGEWKVAELTGTLPMTFRSNGTALINYRIFGTADGAGVQTENLFNKNANDTNNGYVSGCVLATGDRELPNNSFIISEYIEILPSTQYFLSNLVTRGTATAICFYNSSKNYLWGTTLLKNGVPIADIESPKNAAYMRTTIEIAILDLAMITKNKVSEYIPHGYKLPVLLGGKNLWNKEAASGESFRFYMNFINGTYMQGQPQNNRVLFIPIEGGKEYEITLNNTYQYLYTVNSIDKPNNGVTYKIDGVSTFINHGAVKKFVRKTDAKAKWLAVHIYAQDWENVDVTIKDAQSYNLYIGDSKLLSGDYVDYKSGKIIRNGTPQDPPLPLPELETYNGTNTLDSAETLGEVTIKGQIKPQS